MNAKPISTALVALCVASAVAHGAVIERTYYLPTALGGANSGYAWAIEQYPIEPFVPVQGDTLLLHLQFDRRLILRDDGADTSAEMIMIILDSGATTAGGVDAKSNGTFSFPDAGGSLLTPTVNWAANSGGFGIAAVRFLNLTDDEFSFSKLDVTWNLPTFSFTPPMVDLRYIWTSFDADSIHVESVPEPATLALVGVALLGAAVSRRSKPTRAAVHL